MRFWDASAIVPLLLREPASAVVHDLYRSDPHLLVWWSTELECVSAVSRRERDGTVDARGVGVALERLDRLRRRWDEMQPVPEIRDQARRLLRVHPLRAGDALQLAAAQRGCEYQPATLPFVCLDRRLSDATAREGLPVLGLS